MNEEYEYKLVGFKKNGDGVYTRTSFDGEYFTVKVVDSHELPAFIEEEK